MLVARCTAASKMRTLAPRAFEVVWSEKRRILVDVADYGSIGFASLLLFFACKIRGCHFPDPLHGLHDDHNNAMTASGLPSMTAATRTSLGSKLAIFVDYKVQPVSACLQPMPVTSVT